jgi:UDP-glucose 4-epimerase
VARRAFVTGGAGFIGSHVADAFAERGYEVLAVDDLSTGLRENLGPEIPLEVLDITDQAKLESVAQAFAPSVVCHLAAQASVTLSVREPARDLDVNVRGTLHVCELARAAGAPVVFASTGGALYGDDVPLPTPESTEPRPLSPYGASKHAGEAYVGTWARLHGLANVVLRLGNVYGPRQNPHGEAGVVAIFSDRLQAGEPPTVYGHGEPTRDYVHVTDVARAFVLTAEGGKAGTFNVGTGVETSVSELLRVMQDAAGTSIEPRLEDLRSGELRRSALDSSRIAEELGWKAEIPVETGLRDTYAAFAAATVSSMQQQ